MRYRLLGCTGLKVSELCLGTMTFGGGKTISGIDQATATALVDCALEAGINFVDTADVCSASAMHTTGCGMQRFRHILEDNLQSPNVQLSQEELARLDIASTLSPEYPGWMLAEQRGDRM